MNRQLFITIFLYALTISTALAALPNITPDGKPFPSLSPMIKEVNPAVVNISTYSKQKYTQNPLLNDPFFRRFFNLPDPRYYEQRPLKRQQSAGSGVIVDAEHGYIMTNHHVIKGADEVLVSLSDGRDFIAEVLGVDSELDIAILEVEASNLKAVKFADSDVMEVGDFVVAIGNPFGLGQTVTTGVISALGRTGLGIEGYENFIQTDASINPGNSGGALVNLAGELVGINTAIISPAGGNVGIGFAIPANMAYASMLQIVDSGEVKRGQIGIGIQDITPNLREAFKLENGRTGVLITQVVEDSPAFRAGLRTGDVIIAIDGKPTTSTGILRSQIGMKAIGQKARVALLRDGRELNVDVKVQSPDEVSVTSKTQHKLLSGVQLQAEGDNSGVRVIHVAPNSTAAYSGLRPGDLIVSVNQQRVKNLKELNQALARSRSTVLLRVERQGGSLFIVIE
ncbi:DegQ family serine endoprotease [Alteromonas ponticola]|uniref:DegQ family serine endoprotease n=1 Tax=Alteromonas aquimaris TaxID=2998417 RepID=A0ABT3P9X6_9ALTE|nr:DegQ family serine endoprotease [Alteromonas aquimaris]MCW8109582.1 DegQ family serine endoprotease [Alteromonas aquimaris]